MVKRFLFENNSNEDAEFFTWTSPYATNLVFKSHEDLKDWAQNKARSLGYIIVTQRSKTNANGFVNEVDLMCDLGGESTNEYRLVEDLTKKNVASRDILSILNEQNENNVSILKDIYNVQYKIRKASKLGKSAMQVLMSLLHINRGRPCLKKHQKKRQDHNKRSNSVRLFGIDLNVEPARHSSYQGDNTRDLNMNYEPARHISYVMQAPTRHYSYKDYISEFFHNYIIGVHNVEGDGNFGFRSVAVGLGLDQEQWPQIRSDLVLELNLHWQEYTYIFGTKDCNDMYNIVMSPGRWMSMPDTGLVIASAYNKAVIYLSKRGRLDGSCMYFPLWSSPPQLESRETIVMALVNGDHFIGLTLREGCPLPLTDQRWRTYRNDIAAGWEESYFSRQEVYRENNYRTPETFDLT